MASFWIKLIVHFKTIFERLGYSMESLTAVCHIISNTCWNGRVHNKLYVAICLFCIRSKMKWKRGYKRVAHKGADECVTAVFTTFWCLLWSITVQTRSNKKICSFSDDTKRRSNQSSQRPQVGTIKIRNSLILWIKS